MEMMFEDDSIAQWRRQLDQDFRFSATQKGLFSYSWSHMLMYFHASNIDNNNNNKKNLKSSKESSTVHCEDPTSFQ